MSQSSLGSQHSLPFLILFADNKRARLVFGDVKIN